MRSSGSGRPMLAALLLLALIGVGVLGVPEFTSSGNLTSLLKLIGLYGIFSLGAGLVILTGGIDLSIGALLSLLGVSLAILLRDLAVAPAVAVAVVLSIAALAGLAHGILVARLRLQPFLVTLCGLLVYRSLARWIANDESKGFGTSSGFEGLRDIATGSLVGVPAPFVAFVVVAIAYHVIVHRTRFGRHVVAVGANEAAAAYAGIRTQRVLVLTYVLAATTTGIAAIGIAFYTNSMQPSSHGNFYELYGIAAAVLGGASLRGGEGTVLGIALGTAVILLIQNLVNLLGIPSAWNLGVLGGVILFAIVVEASLARRRGID